MTVLLVGAPNSGKSSIFNSLTDQQVNTANYPGATVEFSKADLKKKWDLHDQIIDTPGLPSLTPLTPEQLLTANYIKKPPSDTTHIIVTVDSTQLSRHLYLVEQLKQYGFPFVVCLTMVDLLEKGGKRIDVEPLKKHFKTDFFIVNGRTSSGFTNLINKIRTDGNKHHQWPNPDIKVPSDYDIEKKYQLLDALEKKCIIDNSAGESNPKKKKRSPTNWDSFFLHQSFGLVTFFLIMTMVFTSIFYFAAPLMDIIDSSFGFMINWIKETLPSHWLVDLFADGVIAGLGSVIIFLPQIIILFLLMGMLEDSGYLARGAMLIDKPLSKIGLSGRSFVPLLSGFACAIPAMMAARTIPSKRERLLTIFIIPLMSCSARLPVYTLLLAFITPDDKPWIGGLALSSLYFLSIVVGSIFTAVIFRLKLMGTKQGAFQLELPVYRKPLLKMVIRNTFVRSKNYFIKAGPTIIVISILLWALTHFPLQKLNEGNEYSTVSHSYASVLGKKIEPIMKPLGLDWRAGVAMMMGFAAREVFVSAMALMYRIDEDAEGAVKAGLLKSMETETFPDSDQRIFTFSSVVGLIFFFAVALQCFPTVVVAKNEIGRWKIPIMQLVSFTLVAYFGSMIIVQVLRTIGFT